MKRLIFIFLLCFVLIFPFSGFSLEYIWTDKYGNRIFDCGGQVVGGKAAIRDMGKGIYRVRGVLINREVRANSIIQAAKIACGEMEEYMPVDQPPAPATPEEQ